MIGFFQSRFKRTMNKVAGKIEWNKSFYNRSDEGAYMQTIINCSKTFIAQQFSKESVYFYRPAVGRRDVDGLSKETLHELFKIYIKWTLTAIAMIRPGYAERMNKYCLAMVFVSIEEPSQNGMYKFASVKEIAEISQSEFMEVLSDGLNMKVSSLIGADYVLLFMEMVKTISEFSDEVFTDDYAEV